MQTDILKIALIPAYKPAETLIDIIKELKERGFTIVTVNDGSGAGYEHIFDEARQYSDVLEHRMNLGKGAALKTGLCSISINYREPYVVVTLDADGQHCIDDVCRAAEAAAEQPDALILGSRAFSGKVPLKSRLGNAITRAVFAITSGRKVYDTQTGLRAFSDRHTARMTDIAGDRYEYEMNVLMSYARSKTNIVEIPIETIYIDGNASSHFRPVRDAYRIYKEILKFSASSLISFCIDYVLFCLLSALTDAVVFPNVAARIASATVNFEINRRLVFKSTRPVKQSAPRYIALALFILVCNTFILSLFTQALGMNAYAAKVLTECMMFFVSWAVQHSAVFSDNTNDSKGEMKNMKHRYVWAAGYGAALVLFTGYVMLDTFVIPTVSASDAGTMNMSMFDNIRETTPVTDSASTVSDAESNKPEKRGTDSSRSASKPSEPERENEAAPSQGDTSRSSRKKAPDEQQKKESSDTTASSSETQPAVTAAKESKSEESKPAERDSAEAPAETTETKSSSRSSKHNKSDSSRKPSSRGKDKPSDSDTTSVISNESVSGETYKDENISIKMSEYYENDTKIYVADITLSSAQYLKTAFANDSYGKNVTAKTSDIAAAKNAILAINGDYYGARESGYVIRNGVIYRSTGSSDTDILCIYSDGHFEITNSSEKTAEQLLSDGVWQAFSFGPALIKDGSISVTKNQEVGKAMASNPRTAIGIIDDLHYVFVVADGRTSESSGLSLSQLASFMQSLGVKTAYNLDGGGSSTMYFDGKVINNPTTSGSIKERSVSDIVYIG